MDGNALVQGSGARDCRYSLLQLLRQGRGEVFDGNMDLAQSVSHQDRSIMAAFVKVHQNRDPLVRQRTQRGFSTGIRAAKYLVHFNPYPVIRKDAGSPEKALQAEHDHRGTLAQGDLKPVLIGPKSCESYYCCLLRQTYAQPSVW